MYNERFEQLFKANKNLSGPLNEWNKTTTELCRRAAQQNLEMIGENFTRFSEQLKRLSSVRKPEDLISFQKDCINEDVTATLENMQKIIRMTMESVEEFTNFCSSSMHESVAAGNKTVEKDREKERAK